MLQRWFLDHPRSVGETYFEHQRMAFGFSARLLAAACACLVHGLMPSLFERTASGVVTKLHERMVVHRLASNSFGNQILEELAPSATKSHEASSPNAAATDCSNFAADQHRWRVT